MQGLAGRRGVPLATVDEALRGAGRVLGVPMLGRLYGCCNEMDRIYNSDLLKVLFTNETIAYEYRSSIQEFNVSRDDRLNLRNWQVKIARQITKRESILERLDLYPAPNRTGDP